MREPRRCAGCALGLFGHEGVFCSTCSAVEKYGYTRGHEEGVQDERRRAQERDTQTDILLCLGTLLVGLVVGLALGMLWR